MRICIFFNIKTANCTIKNKDDVEEDVIFNGQRIMLVEDVQSNREIIRGYLENLNLKIVEAENGLEAINNLDIFKPDLILMDIMMPVMNGREAMIEIKRNPTFNKIPIIALTAFALKQEEDVIKNLCDGYLRKPISKNELINSLKTYLQYTKIEKKEMEQTMDTKKISVTENSTLNKNEIKDKAYTFDRLIKVANNDEKTLQKWILEFVDNINSAINLAELSIYKKDFVNTDLLQILHQIRGIAPYFGTEKLKFMLDEYDNFVYEDELDKEDVRYLLVDILNELNNVEKFYKKIIYKNND